MYPPAVAGLAYRNASDGYATRLRSMGDIGYLTRKESP
jgi:hypothetical protein